MNNTNPIDHAIVALLFTFEGLCWIINELAGFHANTAQVTETEIEDPRDTIAIEAPVPAATSGKTYSQERADQAAYQAWAADIASLTIRELREITNIKSSRYNKKALQELALAGVTSYLR